MAGLLDESYGVSDAKRERATKRVLIGLVAISVIAGTLYFLFRNYKEEARVKEFVEHINGQRYKEAYALWGCTDATPCRDYSLEKFMEDWGPKGEYGDFGKMKLAKVKSCDGGIIQLLHWDPKKEVNLWVNRSDLTLSFAPWPICNPRYPAKQP